MLKQPKIRNEKYRRWVAGLPCAVDGKRDVQCAHIRSGTGGGLGLKPSDDFSLPLCVSCHAHQHEIGERVFWGNSLEKAKELAKTIYSIWERYGKDSYSQEIAREEAIQKIVEFRRCSLS